MRIVFFYATAGIWLACFGVALFTVIPLSAMGALAIFDGSFSFSERLQGFGFALLGLVAVVGLFWTLGLLVSRPFSKAPRMSDQA
ncbi:hypothetical protein [Qipengyuania sp. SM2507]